MDLQPNKEPEVKEVDIPVYDENTSLNVMVFQDNLSLLIRKISNNA